MAKDKSSDKKDKKEKKEKRSTEENGVKKSKKDKKDKSSKDVTTSLLNTLEAEKPGSVAVQENGDVVVAVAVKDAEGDVDMDAKEVGERPLLGALVPFANPLADEKTGKKVLKSVKKAAKHKALKRGVKEVVKSLRKSAAAAPSSTVSDPAAVVVLAADISPMDVISHIPVLCEDHNIPYIYVPSRAELGAAGNTKRPTSVVMITKDVKKGKKEDESKEDEGEHKEAYADLVKVVGKASRSVRV
ncbi:hypothetical protein W97_08849 [Coniosporium apollinis CBS 100218]|uniref:H/ACA ribonucleoprotein complex subunit 2 n=1 Tax=Coniosporium apollinis (strain CBS 100218) TaxID=1168221 RepID=R7Z6H2_CONA1|nr:uncharacterized protein W97_08849 [Coniosporium apollinis CBS 100218]EON69589.1 hypothetical protein W97_08849 [Coniosporium apollinis CBS 100218]